MRYHAGIALLAAALLGGCAATNDLSQDVVLLQVKNDTPGKVTITFTPQFTFEDGSPASENTRQLELEADQTKPLELRRGNWEIVSVPEDDIANPDGDHTSRERFLADGNYTVEPAIMRYVKTGAVRQPMQVVDTASDPIRLRGTDDFSDRKQ